MNEAQTEYLQRIAGEHRAVPEAGCRKPDPSEPWRYVCPSCGGQVQGNGLRYRCKACDVSHDKDALRDKKGENDA